MQQLTGGAGLRGEVARGGSGGAGERGRLAVVAGWEVDAALAPVGAEGQVPLSGLVLETADGAPLDRRRGLAFGGPLGSFALVEGLPGKFLERGHLEAAKGCVLALVLVVLDALEDELSHFLRAVGAAVLFVPGHGHSLNAGNGECKYNGIA